MDEIRMKVDALLSAVCVAEKSNDDLHRKNILRQVREELVKMIVVSVSPPIKKSTEPFDDDFSRRKEAFIAP